MARTTERARTIQKRKERHDYAAIFPVFFADLAEGKSGREAAAKHGVALSVLLYKIGQDNKLAEQYARYRAVQAERLALEIIDLADEEPERGPDGCVDSGWEAYRRGRIDARKWSASKILPKKYGDRQEIEHSGAVAYVAQVPTRPASSAEWAKSAEIVAVRDGEEKSGEVGPNGLPIPSPVAGGTGEIDRSKR